MPRRGASPPGTKRKRKAKVKPSSYPTLPERMTDDEELALALVLWKSLRCHELLTGKTGTAGGGYPTYGSEEMGDLASALAHRCGVRDLYYELMFKLRLVLVTLTPTEE